MSVFPKFVVHSDEEHQVPRRDLAKFALKSLIKGSLSIRIADCDGVYFMWLMLDDEQSLVEVMLADVRPEPDAPVTTTQSQQYLN